MQNFRFDLMSFWLGFLSATIVWGLITFIRPRLPRLRAFITKTISEIRSRNNAGVDALVRREALKRAQRMHLAGSMFALDEILIKPRLIAPPAQLDSIDPSSSDTLIDQTVPYTPDWPELSTSYAVTTISLPEAMQNGANVALIGEPGSGKTVALAHFVSLVARKSPEAGLFADFIPCLVNIKDINLSAIDSQDPTDVLIKSITSQFSILVQPQIPGYLRRKLNEKSILLLVDGLDELPPSEIHQASGFVSSLLAKNPSLRIALAGSPSYLNGFLELGFYPLSLAGWGYSEQTQFLHEWGYLWSSHITPEVRKQTEIEEVPLHLMNNWLESDHVVYTPFEWTVKTWLSFSGESNGYNGINWLDIFVHRFIKEPIIRNGMEKLALKLCSEGKATLSFSDCEKYLSGLPAESLLMKLDNPVPEDPSVAVNSTGKSKKTKEPRKSLGGRILEILIQQGFLVEYTGEQITFLHPIITGYLSSFAVQQEPPAEIINNSNWLLARVSMQYTAAQTPNAPWIETLIKSDQSPLLNDVLMVGRWIKDAPLNAPWRSIYMKRLIGLLQSESLPIALRARLFSVCISANDPSMLMLTKQFISSKSHIIRRLAALVFGALPGNKNIDQLLELIADPVIDVRNAACLALAAIHTPAASDALIDILLKGDESLQQAAAESLAYRGEEGWNILREAITAPDLLVRRAAILGLARIHEKWALDLLEKVAVEDGQWVVRNAAVHMLEEHQKSHLHIPDVLPPASQAPWLLEYAAKKGVGLRPDQTPTDMLIDVLKTGSSVERIAALRYLRLANEEGIIGAIYQTAYLEQNFVADAGLYAVWFISISGAKLPPLAQYGVG